MERAASALQASVASDRAKRRNRWIAAAALIAILGLVGGVLSARSVARNAADQSRQSFKQAAAEVASTLQLAIQRENDLIVNAKGFVLSDPNISNTKVVEWARSVHALTRYPELGGFGYSIIVPPAELAAFAERVLADPPVPLPADGTFRVSPEGDRPFYCLLVATVSRDPRLLPPSGYDSCGPDVKGSTALLTRDSGRGSYLPFKIVGNTWLVIQMPIYRGGVTPTTVAARREAFVGWVAMGIVPKVVLERSLRSHPNLSVSMRYHVDTSSATFRSGRAPAGAQGATIDLHNGWTIRIFGEVVGGGIFASSSAWALLVADIALGMLLAALVFVLGTGRARALRLVGEKTGELRHQALHDALTGLPNRALIMDRIEQLLARNRRHNTQGAALFIDLDEFKNVNDSLGHETGDRLLQAVAVRLSSTLRDADTIGRMGGDEFVVLVDGSSMEVAPDLVAQRLLEVMRQPFELEGTAMPLIVTTSVGMAMGDRAMPGELLRDADVALYEAKARGKNRCEIFEPEMQTAISERIELEFDLRSALAGDQFHLVYQPIFNLDDLTLVGVEALLRWDHPIRGMLDPDEFLPILEQTGQIREVGHWVLLHACEQMATWHDRGDNLDLSVNVSGRQLDNDDVIDHVREALDVSGLDPTTLIIEVTETTLMRNIESTARRLQAIKDLGPKIAVDDFGTGYSSLAYLQQFPVDCLKIDRRFVDAIATSPESKALVSTLVQLGKDLGLKTLAEGVETLSQMEHLRGTNVNEAQGFLLARPLSARDLERQHLTHHTPVVSTNT